MSTRATWYLTAEQGKFLGELFEHLDQMLEDVRAKDPDRFNGDAQALMQTWLDRRWMLLPAHAQVHPGKPSLFSLRHVAPC